MFTSRPATLDQEDVARRKLHAMRRAIELTWLWVTLPSTWSELVSAHGSLDSISARAFVCAWARCRASGVLGLSTTSSDSLWADGNA